MSRHFEKDIKDAIIKSELIIGRIANEIYCSKVKFCEHEKIEEMLLDAYKCLLPLVKEINNCETGNE